MRMDTLSAAYVRGYAARTGTLPIPESVMQKHLEDLTDEELALLNVIGQKAELKMYRFKDHEALPRVHKALGFLRNVWPENLLDVGSGRGVFLFPFLLHILKSFLLLIYLLHRAYLTYCRYLHIHIIYYNYSLYIYE